MPKNSLDELGKITPLQMDLLNRSVLAGYVQIQTSDVPELFHYTGADGLKGIIDNRAIWMTNAAYLNDEQELRYPVLLARGVVQTLADHERDTRRREFLGAINSSLDSHVLYKRWYITSFTIDGNALSQWRAYCSAGGYSLGLDGPKFVKALPGGHSYLYGPIVYDLQIQADRVVRTVQMYFDVWTELRQKHASVPDDEYDRDVAENLAFWLGRELIFFKTPAFESEREWRLARAPLSNEEILFRSRNGVLTPYLNAALASPEEPLPVTQVFVSPLGDVELATHAAQVLLTNRDYDHVRLFRLPYRLRF